VGMPAGILRFLDRIREKFCRGRVIQEKSPIENALLKKFNFFLENFPGKFSIFFSGSKCPKCPPREKRGYQL